MSNDKKKNPAESFRIRGNFETILLNLRYNFFLIFIKKKIIKTERTLGKKRLKKDHMNPLITALIINNSTKKEIIAKITSHVIFLDKRNIDMQIDSHVITKIIIVSDW
jgi:hypothetical protein